MKFMKLGTKPDAFQSEGNNVRFVTSELPTDITVVISDTRFYLHKFPLLSKSNVLHNLILKASEEKTDEVNLNDIPGGPKAFEICAKFCYGMTVILNAYNAVAARCAAEYLEMTEDLERGNLIYKIEVFLNSSILRSWKDSIFALQTARSLLPWAEDLKIVGRCINSIVSKVFLDPSDVHWSYTCSKKLGSLDQIHEHNRMAQLKLQNVVPKNWWIEDICDLDVGLYKRVMDAIKADERASASLIADAIRAYSIKWLPNSTDELVRNDCGRKHRPLVETIIYLLPLDKNSGCSCRLLLKLLKVVNLIGVKDSSKDFLLDMISLQLEKATVKDLLIRSRPPSRTLYNVQLIQNLVSRFLKQDDITRSSDCLVEDEKLPDGSLIAVGKLIDSYLAEIACDPDLPLSTFLDLSRSLPEAARPVHDGLYAAIDVFLQEHIDLTKVEKKKMCDLVDVKKLSSDACLHAAQNDRLPLRVIIQVIYFEQIRSASRNHTEVTEPEASNGSTKSTANLQEYWDNTTNEDQCKSPEQLDSIKITENENQINSKNGNEKNKGGLLLPSQSRRIFHKLWMGKLQVENNKSVSATSESSQSPPISVVPGESKSTTGSSSRNRSFFSKMSGMNPHENEGKCMSTYQEEQEAVIKKKYGGMLPKKPPLISKDHERAFFDSADWALGKQGAPAQKPKGPLEALRPKLQPTRQQQGRSRRSSYAPADGEDGGSSASEDMNCNE